MEQRIHVFYIEIAIKIKKKHWIRRSKLLTGIVFDKSHIFDYRQNKSLTYHLKILIWHFLFFFLSFLGSDGRLCFFVCVCVFLCLCLCVCAAACSRSRCLYSRGHSINCWILVESPPLLLTWQLSDRNTEHWHYCDVYQEWSWVFTQIWLTLLIDATQQRILLFRKGNRKNSNKCFIEWTHLKSLITSL